MRIEVVGLGKAGLPLAAIIADSGFEVIGLDISKERVEQINNGKNPFSDEPGLDDLIKKYGGRRIKATTDIQMAAKETNVHIILVPLFLNSENQPDFRYIDEAVMGLLTGIKKNDIVVIETTLPVGTIEDRIKPKIENAGWRVGQDVFLAYSPERLMSGFAISRFKEFPKIIAGVDEESSSRASEVYRKFIPRLYLVSNTRTAEMIKISEGVYRDVNIALANELFKLCEKDGIKYNEVRQFANHEFCHLHQAGLGVGGHCIPVYPNFLIQKNKEGTPLIQLSRKINDGMVKYWIETIKNDLKKLKKQNVTICINGLTYRPGVKELYHSRSLELVKQLKALGFDVYAWDSLLSKEEIESLGIKYKKPEECEYVFGEFLIKTG
ncbi:UDP-N-acetyl-D-mannosamine dehydrogenase [Candidatus Bilamarchaeum dharawalense]|uniref:UDP-N-acetyl-D-mannosamine dehydrogenase n=1 Tax=Candidatus Bilamarchaeum dharawalense TaxID=2885759 RepID=A0A5E4LN18_9ARCH|nr:UDP-N-acetyl-D-mannosamine dehydrogenase [Candidatus Bilamarchaeum dharawalense]